MAVDGSITIGIGANTDKFDRQITQLEKKMQKEEDKKIEIEAKIKDVSSEKIDKQIQNIKDKIEKTTNAPATLKVNTDIVKMEKELQQYDLAREKAKEYKKQLNELEQKQREMRRANPTLATSRDTGEYKQVKDDIQEISRLLQENNKKILEGAPRIDQVSNSLDKLKEKQSSITNKVLEYKNTLDTLNTQKQQEINNKTEQYKKQLQEINQNISEYKQKIENVKIQKQVADVERLKQGFNSVGSSIQSTVSKVAKLALGVLSVAGAYSALIRASSDLASYDQQYATNLEYIRYALTQAIAPVLRYIVELAVKVLQYINMILNALFGINIFSRGSAESFNKMKAGAGGALKAVKEIKKQLAGFDEINMLTDQSDTGTTGGIGGIATPSFDLSALNVKQPKWLEWIVKNKKNILSILAGIAGGLTALKLGWGALAALGIGFAITGIIDAVRGLLDFMKNPTWENYKKFLGGLAVAITGVAAAMIAFNATNPVGWILLAIGAVIALETVIGDLIVKLITNRAKILDTKKAQEELTQAQQKAKEATDAYVNAVDRAEQAQRELTDAERRNKMSGEELYRKVQEGTLDYQNMTSAQREVYKAYLNNKSAQEELKNATEELNNAKKEETKASWENQLAIAKEKGNYDGFRNSVVKAYHDGKLSAEEARDYIERAMGDMSDSARQTFTKDLPNDIKNGLDPKKYESAWSRFKTKWNNFWNGLQSNIKMRLSAEYSFGGAGGGGGFRAKGGIFYPSKLPRLAVGGIINQPGRGIPYHGAVIGERGAEAVVPLTDSQQMELLGQTIGRYITINANIPVNMNGRTISRELKQVRTEQEFAYNS